MGGGALPVFASPYSDGSECGRHLAFRLAGKGWSAVLTPVRGRGRRGPQVGRGISLGRLLPQPRAGSGCKGLVEPELLPPSEGSLPSQAGKGSLAEPGSEGLGGGWGGACVSNQLPREAHAAEAQTCLSRKD